MNENINGTSFFNRPNVEKSIISIADGVPFGVEKVSNSALGIGGAYCGWGKSFDNKELPLLINERLGNTLGPSEVMNLEELGFLSRHHIQQLSNSEHLEVELEVGTRLLKQACVANGWEPGDVSGVMIGSSSPASLDYVEEISRRAGIPESAMTVSIHKACDGSMGALHLALNPQLALPGQVNIAEELSGKKVLVGGIEGLSRFLIGTKDKHALQLFGNGAGVIGVIPGESMKLIAGRTFENYDVDGLLQVKMCYPHSKLIESGKSLIEYFQESSKRIRFSGMQHEPADGLPVVMAGLMGMVKLFVRSGVQVVTDVIQEYSAIMEKAGTPEHKIDIGIVHHANYKINLLKAKQLIKEGIEFPMPWLLKDFGNVSAASCMIAFLRQLPEIKPGEHVLFDGFGAGTYYDVMAIAMGG